MALTLMGVTTLAELRRRVAQNPYGFAEEVWELMGELRALKTLAQDLEKDVAALDLIAKEATSFVCTTKTNQ